MGGDGGKSLGPLPDWAGVAFMQPKKMSRSRPCPEAPDRRHQSPAVPRQARREVRPVRERLAAFSGRRNPHYRIMLTNHNQLGQCLFEDFRDSSKLVARLTTIKD